MWVAANRLNIRTTITTIMALPITEAMISTFSMTVVFTVLTTAW